MHTPGFLRTTRFKIWCAYILYRIISLFLKSKRETTTRDGIRLSVDLKEGIDLSMFLFGSFQDHVLRHARTILSPDAVVFDVGANVGTMSLPLAKIVPQGTVHAFEPTDFALKKLRTNLDLNPSLASRIKVNQAFVSDRPAESAASLTAYSSWPVTGDIRAHAVHGGVPQNMASAPVITLDEYCRFNNIQRVDFIKIDTDGHELNVLRGTQDMLRRFRPRVVLEVGGYVMREQNTSFQDYDQLLRSCGYRLETLEGTLITEENYDSIIPQYGGTIDIAAVPQTS